MIIDKIQIAAGRRLNPNINVSLGEAIELAFENKCIVKMEWCANIETKIYIINPDDIINFIRKENESK